MVDWRKVGARSRRKGRNFELRVAKILSSIWNMNLRRTPQSGGWEIPGDIQSIPSRLPFSIECKDRSTINLDSVMNNPSILPVMEGQICVFKSKGKIYLACPKKLLMRTPAPPYMDCGEYVVSTIGEGARNVKGISSTEKSGQQREDAGR